jgi:hypothetical protein
MEESLWPNTPLQKGFAWRVSGTVTFGVALIFEEDHLPTREC